MPERKDLFPKVGTVTSSTKNRVLEALLKDLRVQRQERSWARERTPICPALRVHMRPARWRSAPGSTAPQNSHSHCRSVHGSHAAYHGSHSTDRAAQCAPAVRWGGERGSQGPVLSAGLHQGPACPPPPLPSPGEAASLLQVAFCPHPIPRGDFMSLTKSPLAPSSTAGHTECRAI